MTVKIAVVYCLTAAHFVWRQNRTEQRTSHKQKYSWQAATG